MIIRSGLVGIGTDNPSVKLDIKGGGTSPGDYPDRASMGRFARGVLTSLPAGFHQFG